MRTRETIEDADSLALRALVWTLAEPDRALRLISLTGLEPSDLRSRITDPTVLAASLAFLEAHEPDLIACAEGLGVKPEALVRARHTLENT
ncbi:DUF3572 domain-containing protein [Sphingomonas sp. SUN019]|uniref:DUF3572 domain-containing protein n=1 Tax=Sphingomonas sp. SUN019 TaxID=2937788 RepID=UPI0021645098|nr:DUF3572 domain-containing protein [Sphingomonas sp. SUN019]UVO51412.1 DUF3572 domain-containing protein [Sphingomonas sp. SUN019]